MQDEHYVDEGAALNTKSFEWACTLQQPLVMQTVMSALPPEGVNVNCPVHGHHHVHGPQ